MRDPHGTLAHGGGGKAMRDLVEEVFARVFEPPGMEDQARLMDAALAEPGARLAFTTDSFVVTPLEFPGGDIGKLLQLHRQNAAQPIRDEGDVIENLIKRKQHLQQAWDDMQAGLPVQIYRLVLRGDRDLIRETLAQYTYSVPLNQDALMAGAGAAAIVLALTELLLALVRWLSEAVTFRLRGRFS